MFAWPDNLIWLPYQLWLTDDCLLRIVSCIDDPTSFYNIALTNRRLLQVTKSAKSAHHKNLLLLNSEYFIKCLVVESGDDSKLRWLTTVCFVLFCFFQFKVDRLQIIVVAKKYIYMSQLFISRMPKMRAIPQNYWFRLHSILGFHMTSSKFKLRNYRFFWDSEFHEVLQHLNTFI